MQIPSEVRAFVLDQRTRLALAVIVAVCWFVFGVTIEQGRNAAPVVIVGIPAALVLIWWRVKPRLAIALSLAALFLVLPTSVLGSPGDGVEVMCATAWFAVLGASASNDATARWAGIGLALLDVVIVIAASFGYGGVGAFVATAFLMTVAVGAGWGWRQIRDSVRLRTTLAETTLRVDTAERDARLEIERNRIAREVHDVVAHSLAVVIAQADGARFAAEANPATVGPALEAIGDTARRALGEVRTMLHDLKASGGGVAPGADDIAALVDGVRELGVTVQQSTFGEPRPLDDERGLALYRVAQEALTNAMRHGDAAEPVDFELDWGDRQVVLVVTNAVPADAVAATERAGHGIEGMRERVTDAGGDCTAGVGSNGRFRVRVALPVATLPEAQPPATLPDPPPNPLIALFSSDAEARRA